MEGFKPNENKIEKYLNNESKPFDFDFNLLPSESDEDYLRRLNILINTINRKKDEVFKSKRSDGVFIKTKKDYFNEFNSVEFDEYFKKAFRVLLERENQKDFLNEEKNTKVMEEIEFNTSARTYNDNMPGSYIKDDYDSIDYFNKTQQERSFFPSKFKNDSYPYTYSLFEVTNINSNEAREYLKNKLDNKKICLLGGGKSMQDLVESDFVHPKLIVNIDPFLDKEIIDRNINKNYKSLDIKADDSELFKKIEDADMEPSFDEIWASYSVPFYNTSEVQINNLFNNIDKILVEGGNCRITPLNTQNQECANMIYLKLEQLNHSNKYNFDLLDDTLIIHKIKA